MQLSMMPCRQQFSWMITQSMPQPSMGSNYTLTGSFSNHTIAALLVCRVRTSKGVEYEYAIENMNDVISPLELQGSIRDWNSSSVFTSDRCYPSSAAC